MSPKLLSHQILLLSLITHLFKQAHTPLLIVADPFPALLIDLLQGSTMELV